MPSPQGFDPDPDFRLPKYDQSVKSTCLINAQLV